MEDKLLIQRAIRGDGDAFELLAKQYQGRIYALALRISQNESDAFDIAQDVLVKLYIHLPSFKFRSAFSTWVYTMTRNTALDFLRKRREAVSIDEISEQALGIAGAPDGTDPEATCMQEERRAGIAAAINELAADYRRVLVLRDIDGYSYEEIADIVGISLGTVKSRLFRGRNSLREMLRERGLI